MADDDADDGRDDHRITVEASSVDGIADALGFDVVEPEEIETEPPEYPEELLAVMDTLVDVYGGVEQATEQDSRGRSRKMVRQYAGREDLTSNEVGYVLRVLEIHDLIVQDGNRWRLAGGE